MKSREEDVESSAQLLHSSSSQSSPSSEEFDYEESDDSINWSSEHKWTKQSIWRRFRSTIPVPNWLSIRNVNPRYLLFAFIVSLIVTVFVFNPFSSPARRGAKHNQSEGTLVEVPSSANFTTYVPPVPRLDDKFCTTWPVEKNGGYDLTAPHRTNKKKVRLDSFAPIGGWRKPKGLKVIGMVFYGRKRYVDILDCYLQQNLASNGGYLDEVWFMAHTSVEDDVAWVEDLVSRVPEYKVVGQGVCEDKKYKCMWEYAKDDKTIYIKIDDDIIFIHPDAIPQLVHTRISVPHPYAVSANLVNSPITGMEQYHFGAIHPYVPDPRETPSYTVAETWRPSEKKPFPKEEVPKLKEISDQGLITPNASATYRGHPWLLISEDHYDLLKTPMGKYDQAPGGEFIAFGPAWKSWGIGAQQQYSLLHNLERNQMHKYFFGRPAMYPPNAVGPKPKTIIAPAPVDAEGKGGKTVMVGGESIYDTQYRRYNLNFCAVWGSDIRDQLPLADDDEQDITADIPKRLKRPFIVDTRAVVAHFSFFTQQDGISRSDLLDRWRAFANEGVCKTTNLKKPWDLMCPDFKLEGMS